MVDQEAASYRPRRAALEPDPEPEPLPPTPGLSAGTNGSTPSSYLEEDVPKPLYRDEVSDASTLTSGQPVLPAGSPYSPTPSPSEDTLIRQINFAPRRPPYGGDETTTILPRSRAGGRMPRGRLDELDDFDDDDERRSLGPRAKLALVISGVAAVVVLGLAVGYAVLGIGTQRTTVPDTPPSSVPSNVEPSTDPAPTEASGALLTDEFMLSTEQADALDPDRSWEVALTQRGASEDAPIPACFSGDPVEGQPASQQKIIQVLSSSGKKAPSALHEATAYATPEEAIQAFGAVSRALGGCAVVGSYIESGRVVSGLGDQATAIVAQVSDGNDLVRHNVVLSRSGRVLNLLDVTDPDDSLRVTYTARALGEVVAVQCAPAGGDCSGTARVKQGPPPMGGDEPGFLATGDLPPAGPAPTPWSATPIDLPKDDFTGSGCENTNWATVPAEERSSRIYLLQESGSAYFGVNEVVLTLENRKAANKLADRIKKNLKSCKDRKLTAEVSKTVTVRSTGARSTDITGYTATVEQKAGSRTTKFRVGVVWTDSKLIYTFANPTKDYDFTNDQWETIATRAGERVTQVT
jgi:hypothetical protein